MKQITLVLRVLFTLLILEFSLAVHEYGHLKEFQKRGVPIEEFSLGIGPRLYSYQTDSSVTVNLRLVPIMAYVAPTEQGGALFEREGSLWDKIIVDTAGVWNNFFVGLVVVFFLQVFGWSRGNLSTRELAWTMLVTPFKISLRFAAFLIGCATLGYVNVAEKFLLSTGGINPPESLKQLTIWNLMLGIFNLVPVPPLDGGAALQAVLFSVGADIYIPHISPLVAFLLFVIFFTIASHQDLRVLKLEQGSGGV